MPPRMPASAEASNAKEKLGLSEHLAFLFGSAALLVTLLTLLRVALLLFNRELIGSTAWTSLDIRELITLSADADNLCGEALTVVKKHLAAVEQKVTNLKKIREQLLTMSGTCESTCLGSTVSGCNIVEALFVPAAGARSGCC
ncbi:MULTISPECIES: MerR family DNA-binding protein [Pseudomonadaceae]|uniref:MerR family DNA-binding protein n=1 Tax=Pseudomonadaceae TaxID=135621 RepID=UPI0014615F8D|nr:MULTISPECIES: MerR family DNA-binding protein [Pseudomonadaceae]